LISQVLYGHCLASGLKTRMIFSHAAGTQVTTMTCSLPMPSTTAVATAARRRRRPHHGRRRGRATRTEGASPALQPSSIISAQTSATPGPAVATPDRGKACSSPPRPLATSSSPDVMSPPAKKTKKQRNELELLRSDVNTNELLLSPLRCTASPPPSSPLTPSLPPSSPCPPGPSPELALLCSPAPLERILASTSSELSTPPVLPESSPSAALPSEGEAPAFSPSSPTTHRSTPVPADASLSGPAASTIPVAPPMSPYFPSCSFKVICRYCFHDDHDICYKQCPSCYKKKEKKRWNNLFRMVISMSVKLAGIRRPR
jgi:hypothetical protein